MTVFGLGLGLEGVGGADLGFVTRTWFYAGLGLKLTV